MSREPDTLFCYWAGGCSRPTRNAGYIIVLGIFINVVLVAVLAILVVNPEHIEFPTTLLFAIWTLVMIVVSNLAMFASSLQYAGLELTQEKVTIHISRFWKVPINLHELQRIQIQERTIEGANVLGFANREYTLYFISSPNLPWHFRFAGFAGNPLWQNKRGFFITSWHTNYEAFLDKMRAYEAQ